MKIIFYFLLITSLSFPQSLSDLKNNLNEILNDSYFERSVAGIDIYDLSAQKYLFRHNEKLLLHPASNMKLFTSAAALLFLGSEYNFTTSIYYDGEISSDTLYGSLYIEGGCDPDFTSEDLKPFISEIQEFGIKYITGNIYGDITFKDSVYWGNGWMWDDDPSPDAPYLSALNINDNSVTVEIYSGKIDSPAVVIVKPETNFLKITNSSITVSSRYEEKFDFNRHWIGRKNEIYLKGTIRDSRRKDNLIDTEKINVLYPEYYFLTLFTEQLFRDSISFRGSVELFEVPPGANLIYQHKRSLIEVLENLNKESDNLSAEMVLCALAEKFYGQPATFENGIKVIEDLIIATGNNPDVYRLVDGSGLSHYNLVTAELITDLLKYFYYSHPSLYSQLFETLPVAGVDGTLERRMKTSKAYNNVHAKTGTISGVSALSGFLTAANGNKIAFSILMQNHVKKTSVARSIQDEICRILAEYE